MIRTTLLFAFGAILLNTAPVFGADDEPTPPPGRPTREELRERLKNLTPEERQARIREFRERQGLPPVPREEFEKHRAEWEKLREEIKDLPPEQRQARMREFREKIGLGRPGLNALSPEEREAKRKQLQERVEKELSALQKEKASGKLDEEGERRLQRMETILKRLEQGPGSSIGSLPPPVEKPNKSPSDK
jgi:hypothetical protein